MLNLSLIGFRVQNQKPRKNNFSYILRYLCLLDCVMFFISNKGYCRPHVLLNYYTVRMVHACWTSMYASVRFVMCGSNVILFLVVDDYVICCLDNIIVVLLFCCV